MVKYRKGSKLFGYRYSDLVWSGTLSLSHPDANDIQTSGRVLRDTDPIGNVWSINERVAIGIASLLRTNADAIRRS